MRNWRRLPSIGEDGLARTEPGGGRRPVRLDLEEADADVRRREPRDAR